MTARWTALLLPSALAAAGLALASAAPRGGAVFYAATFGVAAVYAVAWLIWGRADGRTDAANGTDAAGGDVVAHSAPRADLLRGVLIGAGLLVVFLLGAQLVRFVPALAEPVHGLLENAKVGPLWVTALTTALNGVGEEAYFRRIVPASLQGIRGPRGGRGFRAAVSLGLYVAVTAALGVPLLAVAALLVGGAAFWEAERSGSLVSPIALHLTWSLGMLVTLPAVL